MGKALSKCATCGTDNINVVRNIQEEQETKEKDSFIIVFGSCNEETKKRQRLWPTMKDLNPDCYLLLGDNIYVDMKVTCMGIGYVEKPAREFDRKYQQLLDHPDFIISGKQQQQNNYYPHVLAIWDDHDYGEDNADGSYPYKEESKESFIKFHQQIDPLNRLKDKYEEMKIPDRGIYYYYDMEKNGIRIRFVMFDVRFHRTLTNILGDKQKQWFEELMQQTSPKDFDWLILGSGSCYGFWASGIIKSEGVERWDRMSWKWLKNLLEKYFLKHRTLLLSGDIHCSLVHRYTDDLYEFTSSSFTHSVGLPVCLTGNVLMMSKYRKTPVVCINSFGCINLHKNYWEFCLVDKHKHTYLNLTNTVPPFNIVEYETYEQQKQSQRLGIITEKIISKPNHDQKEFEEEEEVKYSHEEQKPLYHKKLVKRDSYQPEESREDIHEDEREQRRESKRALPFRKVKIGSTNNVL